MTAEEGEIGMNDIEKEQFSGIPTAVLRSTKRKSSSDAEE